MVVAWPYVEWGGAQTFLAALAPHLGEGFRVRALVPDGSSPQLLDLLAERQIAVASFGPAVDLQPAATIAGRAGRRWRDLQSHRALGRALRSLDPSTTVLHVDLAPWSAARLIRSLRGHVVFQTLHTAPPSHPPLPPLRRRMWQAKLNLVLAAPDYHLTFAHADVQHGFESLLGRPIDAERTPSVVDLDLVGEAVATLDREAERADLGVDHDTALVVGVGQLIARKGIDVLIDAVAARQGPPLAVRWFGDGPDHDALVDRARAAGVVDQVQLLPSTARPSRLAVLRAMAAADVYVQPSREEGLPLALVEAMGTGVPAVATAVNAVPELIAHDDSGLLVAVDQPAELAAAIDRLLADDGLAEKLGRAGAARVAAEHDAATVGVRLGAAYRRALAERAQR